MVAAIDGKSKRWPGLASYNALASAGDDFVAHLGGARAYHADVLCGGTGKVEDTASNEWTAIIDANDDAAAIVAVGNSKLGAEAERTVCGS